MPSDTQYLGYRGWNRIRNSGDAITADILSKLSGLPSRFVSHETPHVLGVGSILFLANEHSHVWGSGILNPQMPIDGATKSHYCALRGKKTYEFLSKRGIKLPDLPLGDPGIFASNLCEALPASSRTTRFRAAVIPHHGSIDHPFYTAIAGSQEFVLVDILDNGLLPLKQILQSEVIISQSLHGLIYAESLGIPNIWISDRVDDIWRFKFDDWFSTATHAQANPEPLTTELEHLISRARLHHSTIDKLALASALPTPACTGAAASFLDVHACRKFNPAMVFVDTLFGGRQYAQTELSAEHLALVSNKIFPLIWRLYSHWAERGYCLVAPGDEATVADPDNLSRAIRYLDENADIDFAFIIDKRLTHNRSIRYSTFRCTTDVIRENPIAGGAVLVRPDSFQLSNTFVTLCV